MSKPSPSLLSVPGEEPQPATNAPVPTAAATTTASGTTSPRPAAAGEPDLSTVDPNLVTRIVIASEGREVPLDVDPSATPLPDLIRLLITSKDAAQRLAARVLGTTPSHVMGDAAINVKVTRAYRESDRTLVIEAVKQPGQKGNDSPRSSQIQSDPVRAAKPGGSPGRDSLPPRSASGVGGASGNAQRNGRVTGQLD